MRISSYFRNPAFKVQGEVFAMPLTESLLENDYNENHAGTPRLPGQDLKGLPIRHAAYFLHEGRLNLHLDEHPTTKLQLQLWNFLHLSWFIYFDVFMAVMYLLLALVENPAVPGLENFPEPAIIFIQIMCLSTLLFQLFVKFKITATFTTGKYPKGFKFQLGVAILLLADLIVYLLQVYAVDDDNHVVQRRLEFWHVLRSLRPLYLLSTDYAADIRRIMRQIIYVAYEVFEMIFFLFFYVGVFAVAAVFLFRHDPYSNFANLGDSFTQLFVLITTCNYPTVMLPEYTVSKWTFFFFFFFILIGIYFILNLLLAIVYRMYTEEERRKFRKRFLRQRLGIRHAYFALTRDGELPGVSKDIFRLCMREYDPSIGGKKCSLLFSALDRSKSGLVTLDEFYEFFQVHELQWRQPEQLSRARTLSLGQWGTQSKYSTHRIRWLHKAMRSPGTEALHCTVVLAQSIYLTVTAADLPDLDDDDTEHAVHKEIKMVTTAFLLFFTIETIIKISVLTASTYWQYTWHRVDTIFTVLGWVFVAVPALDKFLAPLVILRAFRLTSFLALANRSATSTFKSIANTAFLIFPAMIRFGAALFLVTYYSFAIVGMTYLSHTASRCSWAADSKCGIPYANVMAPANGLINVTDVDPLTYLDPPYNNLNFGGYQEMNFDNIRNAYVTLFTLMVVNDWNNTMFGHVQMINAWVRAYFMLNYVFTVLIVVNVILAYVLEMFQVVVVGQQVSKKQSQRSGALLGANDVSLIGEEDTSLLEGDGDFSMLSDVVVVRLSRTELIEVADPADADLKKLSDPTSDEHRSGFVEYHGKVRITQFALYRLLYSDNIEKWIAQDQQPTRNLSNIIPSRDPTPGSSPARSVSYASSLAASPTPEAENE